MSIGSIIKRLRREKDITQEQLAEHLGITSRAISQWERDRTSPDISQLPALCHIFDVSSDVLLGINIEKSNEEIIKHLTEANDLGNHGKNEERTALLREANAIVFEENRSKYVDLVLEDGLCVRFGLIVVLGPASVISSIQ